MEPEQHAPQAQPSAWAAPQQPPALPRLDSSPAPAAAPIRLMTLEEIRTEYPCDTCTAPCCTYLPLHTFTIANIRDLDHALYLLNFPRIELGLSANGEWGVYYRYPCRFLDVEKARCTIYGDDTRPSICQHYNPYACWYKRALSPAGHPSFLRVNRRRMIALAEQLVFDADMNIVGIPDWAALTALCEALPLDPQYGAAADAEDAVFERWLYDAALGAADAVAEPEYSYTALLNPCAGCHAYCCRYLLFPQPAPTTRVALDYLQFFLGFPGLQVGVSDGEWFVIVRTRCQHLVDNRCAIYGRPERPQICKFYDAHGCQYVPQFGAPRPDSFMRIELEQFYWLVEAIGFDKHGNITRMPALDAFRQHVEGQWAAAVVAQAALLAPAPGAPAPDGPAELPR